MVGHLRLCGRGGSRFTITEYDSFLSRNPGIDFMSYIGDTGVHMASKRREVVA